MLWPPLPRGSLSWGYSLHNRLHKHLHVRLCSWEATQDSYLKWNDGCKGLEPDIDGWEWKSTVLEVQGAHMGHTGELLHVSPLSDTWVPHFVQGCQPYYIQISIVYFGSQNSPLVRRSRCSLRLHGPDEKARLEEVMWPAQAYPSVSSGLRAVTLAAKLLHRHTASHPLLIGAPERQSTGRDGGFTWLDVAFLCSCEFALMIIANLTLRQHVDHGNTQATFHNVYLCFLFSKLNDMRWLPFICEIYLLTPPHHPPSSSLNGKKSFRIQLVHKSLKRKVNQAVWVSFQLGSLGGLKAGAGPLS